VCVVTTLVHRLRVRSPFPSSSSSSSSLFGFLFFVPQEFRKRLRAGEEIPEWFAFKSVVDVLRANQ
jgi:hypothetical protein